MAAVPKQLRFEVFKRDKFKCQYCGAAAPDVLLHADHIKAEVDGGETTLLNLTTACVACNLGKGRRALADDSAVTKQRAQMEALQERHEQLEMMLAWQRGLQGIEQDQIKIARDQWIGLAPGFQPNASGDRNLGRWIRKHGLREVLDAMRIAADDYLQWEPASNKVTEDSWETAWRRIPGICRGQKLQREDPEGAEHRHMLNSMRRKTGTYIPSNALSWFEAARSREATTADLWTFVRKHHDWTDLILDMQAYCKEWDREARIRAEAKGEDDE